MMISPKYDYVMKELFRNQTVLKYFISDILGIPVREIRTIRLANTFLHRRFRKQKQGILDVLAELNDDTHINIELQIKALKYWDRRQLFYLARMYTGDIQIGENYTRLKRCVGIAILDFNLTEREEYHSIYYLKDQNGHKFSDLLELHILELKKDLTRQDTANEWIQFFNAKTKGDLMMIRTKNPGILEAIRVLNYLSLHNPLRIRFEAYLKWKRDEWAREEYVRDLGIAKGRSDDLLEILETLGTVPEELREQIQAEQDLNRLSQWFTLALNCRSLEEFRKKFPGQISDREPWG